MEATCFGFMKNQNFEQIWKGA